MLKLNQDLKHTLVREAILHAAIIKAAATKAKKVNMQQVEAYTIAAGKVLRNTRITHPQMGTKSQMIQRIIDVMF